MKKVFLFALVFLLTVGMVTAVYGPVSASTTSSGASSSSTTSTAGGGGGSSSGGGGGDGSGLAAADYEGVLGIGEGFELLYKNELYPLRFVEFDSDLSSFTIGDRIVKAALGNIKFIDLDGDGSDDLKLKVSKIIDEHNVEVSVLFLHSGSGDAKVILPEGAFANGGNFEVVHGEYEQILDKIASELQHKAVQHLTVDTAAFEASGETLELVSKEQHWLFALIIILLVLAEVFLFRFEREWLMKHKWFMDWLKKYKQK